MRNLITFIITLVAIIVVMCYDYEFGKSLLIYLGGVSVGSAVLGGILLLCVDTRRPTWVDYTLMTLVVLGLLVLHFGLPIYLFLL